MKPNWLESAAARLRKAVSSEAVRVVRDAGMEPLERRQLMSAAPVVSVANITPNQHFAADGVQLDVMIDQNLPWSSPSDFVLTNDANPTEPIANRTFQTLSMSIGEDIDVSYLLAPGNYTYRLVSGVGHIQNSDGIALDGENTGTLPSGNGAAGGDYVIHFTMSAPTSRPAAATGLTAQPISGSAIELNWRAGHSDWGYAVQRAEGDGDFQDLYFSGINGSPNEKMQYSDTTAQPDKTYRYRVREFYYIDDGIAWSDPTAEIAAQVLPPNLAFSVASLNDDTIDHPDWLTTSGGSVYFTGAINGLDDKGSPITVDLWKTDGTPGGTQKLFTGPASNLIDVGGTLYFTGYDADAGTELWKTNGTIAGTQRVADIAPGADSSSPRTLAAIGNTLYFAANPTGNSYQLWSTNGTTAQPVGSTQIYLENQPSSAWDSTRTFAVSGSDFYFRAGDTSGNDTGQLWRTDGTTAGTQMISGIAHPTWPVSFSGALYVSADTHTTVTNGLTFMGRALYKVSATSTTPQLIREFSDWQGWGELSDLTTVGTSLYFTARASSGYNAVWRSDGTSSGSIILDNIDGGTNTGVAQYQITDVGGTAYFLDSDLGLYANLGHLWKSDGTKAGTTIVRSYAGLPKTAPLFMLSAGGKLVYSDVNNLWYSDGTYANSYQIDNVGAMPTDGRPTDYGFAGSTAVALGDRVFYSVANGNNSYSRSLRVVNVTPPAAPSDLSESAAKSAPLAAPLKAAGILPAAAPLTLAAVTSTTGATLNWKDNAGNESGYVVDRIDAGKTIPDESFFVAANSSTFTDPAGVAGSTYRVRAYNAGGYSAAATTVAPPYQPGTTSDNIVSIEAEAFDANTSKKGRYWIGTSGVNYSGGQAMQALPNSKVSVTSSIDSNSPRLDYKINFTKTGTYYLWVRGVGPTSSDDTLHAGLDGAVLSSSDNINGFKSTIAWSKSTSDGSSATIKISKAGVHTLNLWMREDGFIVDKVLLTTNSKYTPSGAGPASSPRGGTTVTPVPTPTPSPTPTGTPTTLFATADAYVRAGTLAKMNFGSEQDLLVKHTSDAERVRQSYVRFDLSSISAISSAKLRLFGAVGAADGGITVGITAVSNTTWVEGNGGTDNSPANELTWTNKPSTSGSVLAKTTVSGTTGKWYEFDLTSYLMAQKKAGAKSVTLLIAGVSETTTSVATFSSREGANAPQLLVIS